MQNDQSKNGQPVSVGSTGVSASETVAGRLMRELSTASNSAAKHLSHLEMTLAFTLGDIKAAIDLLEKGDAHNAITCLRRAHRIGCEEMDHSPSSPNVQALPRRDSDVGGSA